MKFDLGGKQSIEFKTDVKGLEEIAPIKPASFFMTRWFKDMYSHIEMTAVHEKGQKNYFQVTFTC